MNILICYNFYTFVFSLIFPNYAKKRVYIPNEKSNKLDNKFKRGAIGGKLSSDNSLTR